MNIFEAAKKLKKTYPNKSWKQLVVMASKKKAVKNRQTGTTTKKLDKQRSALPPGKRKSRTGRTYYERRKNRSDAQNSLTGIKKGVEEQLQKALWKYEKAKTVKETKAAREQIKKYRAILNKL